MRNRSAIYILLFFTLAAALIALIPGRGYDWTPIVLWSALAALLATLLHVSARGYKTVIGQALWVLPQVGLQAAYMEIFVARLVGLSIVVTVLLFALVPAVAALSYVVGSRTAPASQRRRVGLVIGPVAGAALGVILARTLVSVLPLAFGLGLLVALSLAWVVFWVRLFQRAHGT
jgi:hypothetical protein